MNAAIQTRLLITTALVLGTFLTITGWVLDRSFRASIMAGAREQMQLVVYSLMGAAEERNGQIILGEVLAEPRLNQPESGLYAQVSEANGDILWRSASAKTTAVEFPVSGSLSPGESSFVETADDPSSVAAALSASSRYFLSYAVIWEDADESLLVFSAATDTAPFAAAVAQFRRNLYLGLGAATAFFVFAQLVALRWGLRPLRNMAQEVQELEAGQRQALSTQYPRELKGLARNLGRFIEHEQRNRSRYRNALEDLAHSLKTPLAVIRNALLDTPGSQDGLLKEQLDRMESTVIHQLSRASVTGPVVVGKPVNIGTLLDRLVRALQTAYLDRGIDATVRVPTPVIAVGDERDFMEILGNVIENAFKYTHSQVEVSAHVEDGAWILIDDNGPGIDPAYRKQVLNRGMRADEHENGQGIGLSVVAELVTLYHGELHIETSDPGGTRIRIRLPV